ncbi:hypothetical protein ACJJTC_013480 [Scirpophaga incertulas]
MSNSNKTEDKTPDANVTLSKMMMYSAIQQPEPLAEVGNLAVNWREWKSAFEYYLIASGKDVAPDREKCALFLHVVGKFGREMLEEMELSYEQKISFDVLLDKFSKFCDPARNINFERHVFFELYQKDDTFDKYLSSLKSKSKTCEFGNLRSSLILTQMIRGIKDVNMRERLLSKQNLELDEAVRWCRAAETASRQAVECTRVVSVAGPTTDPLVEEVRGVPQGQRFQRGRGRFFMQQRGGYCNVSNNICDKCGRVHNVNAWCAAKNIKCYKCDRIGHYAKLCKIKFLREVSDNNVENEVNSLESVLYSLSIEAVDVNSSWYEIINVNDVNMSFKLDSGADVSVVSMESFQAAGFRADLLIKDKVILREISRAKLPVMGCFDALLSFKENDSDNDIYDDVTVHVNAMYDNIEASSEMMDRIRRETDTDNELACVIEYYFLGWPLIRNSVKREARSFWLVRNDLHFFEGVLFRNSKIVIPKTLRKDMLDRIHEGHMGIEKCKRRAREVMWWPEMLAPDYIDHEKVRVVRQERNDKMKFYYDGGTRNQRPLEVGEDVRMRNGNVWEKARVIDKASVPRSYWLGNENGGVYRRNRAHILGLPKRNSLRYNYLDDTNEEVLPVATTVEPGASREVQQRLGPDRGRYVTRYGRVVRQPVRYSD